LLALGLFFSVWSTGPWQPDSLLWSLRQGAGQFLSSPLDRLFIQARDLREQALSTWTNALGLQRHLPAPLLFIQAAQQQIHLPMQLLIRMRRVLLAMRTLTLMHLCRGIVCSPHLWFDW
jgi:hypothetical protein